MNLQYYYWYFKSAIPPRICDDIVKYGLKHQEDMAITGGLNVYPKEIELFIDDLAGVKESAVIGVPHPDFGEGVVAIVVREDDSTLDEYGIIQATKENLANYKVPKRVIFVDELLRNTMAKVQKNILRKNYQNLFS